MAIFKKKKTENPKPSKNITPASPSIRVLTAEGWKRRATQALKKSK